jgi:hypothetical protein
MAAARSEGDVRDRTRAMRPGGRQWLLALAFDGLSRMSTSGMLRDAFVEARASATSTCTAPRAGSFYTAPRS